jgi:hypothetical protein
MNFEETAAHGLGMQVGGNVLRHTPPTMAVKYSNEGGPVVQKDSEEWQKGVCMSMCARVYV